MPNSRLKLDKEIHIAVGMLIFAGARAKDPKLLGLVPPRDGVYLVTLRGYLIQHAHTVCIPRGTRRIIAKPPR